MEFPGVLLAERIGPFSDVDTLPEGPGDMAHTPTDEQKKEQLKAVARAIDTICDAWPDALEAAWARGYPTSSPGPSEAPAERSPHDPADPLHCRTISPASGGHGGGGDGGMAALVQWPDVANEWLHDVTRYLVLLLKFTAAEERPERRWTGPFNPPALRGTLKRSAAEIIDWWPKNVDRLLQRIVSLANTARREWPPTPKEGDVVPTPEGKVVVGQRTDSMAETCARCGKQVAGTAADPIRHLSGDPFHATTCYYREYRERRNKIGTAQQSA